MSQLPTRKTSTGELVDTRPMYIEEWLDTLPYIDFNKTTALLDKALAETNKQDIKSSTRMELIELYERPYYYYLESQIKTGAQHTLQTIDAMQSQLSVMKQIAVHLSYSCKLAFDKAQTHKSLWKRNLPPYEILLMSMNYLSQALIFSYLEYSPIPKNVWKQLNFIYDLAASSQNDKKSFSITGPGKDQQRTTFEHTFKRILMASLVDPHHLPFGAIWEIYEQLDHWVERVSIGPVTEITDPDGYFLLELDADRKAIPYKKFNLEKTGNTTRLLDATGLVQEVQHQLNLLEGKQPAGTSLQLSPFYARSLLTHMLSSWGSPPSRHSKRKPSQGSIKLCSGIEAISYFLSDGKPVVIADNPEDEEIDVSDVSRDTAKKTKQYQLEAWQIVDQSSGGAALIRDEKPEKSIKVGQLIALKTKDKWPLGLLRWLMINRQSHKIGIEFISRNAKAIAIRAVEGSRADREFRAALLIHYHDDPKHLSIVTDKGLYTEDREFELQVEGKTQTVRAVEILESGIACEIFTFRKS